MFEQYKLPFAYDALESVIDALTMETHWSKHHATYTKNFNDAVAKAGLELKTAEEILSSLDEIKDESLRTALKNNGGGYYNHNLYFSVMAPAAGNSTFDESSDFGKKLVETFGSFESFKEKISALAASQFGSGWAWLSKTAGGSLVLSQSSNQDNPISLKTGNTPLFCIDVWEHAYYLKFKNLRPAYIAEYFKTVDWKKVEERYSSL